MLQNTKNPVRQSLFGLTAAGKVFFCALAFAGCLSVNVYGALVCCAVCCAASVFLKNRILYPDAFLIVPLVFVAGTAGNALLPLTVIAGAVLFFAVSRIQNALKVPESVMLGASVGLAFSVTALLTTYYFGIGANGATVFEMLKNYRYLGFHPNWRGVFYGTITLFAMITYPFKFRRLSKYLPAEVVSLAIPFVLNLLLNPNGETTPILEFGSLSSVAGIRGLGGFLPVADTPSEVGSFLSPVLQGAFSLAVIMLLFGEKDSKISNISSAASAAAGIFGGFPAVSTEIKCYSVSSAAVAVVSSAAVGLLFPSLLSRLPLHSLAVVLIVSAWQKVKFSRFGTMFKTEKVLGAVLFASVVASFVFLGVFKALVICVLLAALMRGAERRAA